MIETIRYDAGIGLNSRLDPTIFLIDRNTRAM
jgi:hypothetical protein